MAPEEQPADRPAETGYGFPGLNNLHHDIYPAISAAETPALKQEGKVVLVTGASRGIGRAIAIQYAHAGVASLVLTARSIPPLDELEAELKKIKKDIQVLKFAFDVTNDEKVQACADEVKAKVGRLDILINNAGFLNPLSLLADADSKLWWQCMEINVKGPFIFQHAFLPLLTSTAKQYNVPTHVINMSSIGALLTDPYATAYLVSKLAVLRLSEIVSKEYGDQGVNVVGLHPGGVPTDMGQQEDALKPYMIDTAELAGGFCVWLTTEDKKWLNGRYVAVTWDVNRLEEMKDEIVQGDKLKVKMVV